MALSTTEQLILENAKEGHSLLILGQRGIGKSHLVKDYFELDNNIFLSMSVSNFPV